MEHGPQDHFDGRLYETHKIAGPFNFLHPTHRYLPVGKPDAKTTTEPAGPAKDSSASDASPAPGADQQPHENHVYQLWRSRDNRKGRHAVVVSPEYAAKAGAGTGAVKPTNSFDQTMRGLLKMVVEYPVWDVSYDVATIFTWGSVIWVINGFFEWLPLQSPWTQFAGELELGGPITAFIGATVFEIGSVLLMLEAVNENRSDCFGWALEQAWESESALLHPVHDDCNHHHKNKSSWLKKKPQAQDNQDNNGAAAQGASPPSSSPSTAVDAAEPANAATETPAPKPDENTATTRSPAVAQADLGDSSKGKRSWSWWPTWYELRTHYFRDIGFLACSAQMFGASVFWISGLTGLPPILNALSLPAQNGIFWLPQVVGGTGFIVSSALFMLEVQEKWWKPAPQTLGWHIGFWNLIGAIGFTLCGALGFAINNSDAIAYASTLSTFIGSWAFLIGSVIQWYESLDKYPISILANYKQIHESNHPTA